MGEKQKKNQVGVAGASGVSAVKLGTKKRTAGLVVEIWCPRNQTR